MSKQYSLVVTIPVSYTNLPFNKLLTSDLPTHIDITVAGSGYRLFKQALIPFKDTLLLDVSTAVHNANDSVSYLFPSKFASVFSSRLPKNVKLQAIKPDTVYLFFSKSASRRVPIKLNTQINLAAQYRLSEKIKIIPDSVWVTADERTIKKIEAIETEIITLNNISKNTSVDVKLVPLEGRSSLSKKQVHVQISVAKYTERTIELPVLIKNLPANTLIKLFPEKVSVKFMVPLDKYEKTTERLFRVEVDAAMIKNNTSPTLRVYASKYPEWIHNISVVPERIEYIIKK